MAKFHKNHALNDECVPVELIEALSWPQAPREIWQEPFDYIRGHCERIADTSTPIREADLCEYFFDYRYMDVQRDLFFYVLPKALEAWARRELSMPNPQDFISAYHIDAMWDALAARPVYPEMLTEQQYEAMQSFLVRVLISLMQRETLLSFKGSRASPYAWMSLHATLIKLSPLAEKIWTAWWSYPSQQMATCGIQWISTLCYESHENPFFEPYCPWKGGGPPVIFGTLGSSWERSMDAENVDFLRSTLTKSWAIDAIIRAKTELADGPYVDKIQDMLNEFSWRSILFEERVEKFLIVLAKCDPWLFDWDDISIQP